MKKEMKLKTLKDIESVGTIMGIANYYEDIRQEAIKWVKECTAKLNRDNFVDSFNLTEEDLMTNEEINAREHGEIGNN